MNIGICGKGRIGAKVASKLIEKGQSVSHFRIEPNLGLTPLDGSDEQVLDLLIICISSAKSQSAWSWSNIFSGLKTQMRSKQVIINRIIFVSSTRVYDGITHGLTNAETPADPISEKAKSLLYAEQQLLDTCSDVAILRCSGLIGLGYEKYEAMLKTAKDRPRFGVDIAQVVELIVEMSNKPDRTSIDVLTNGNVYYQNKVYSFDSEEIEIVKLAKEYKILINSKGYIQPVTPAIKVNSKL